MRIYTFDVVEDQEWVLPINKDDFEVFRGFDGTPHVAEWKPIRVELLKEDEGRRFRYSDFPWLGQHVPILTGRAVHAVGGVFSRYGELLPLECDEEELWAYNACEIIDALDVERSRLVRFQASGRIMRVETYVFRLEIVDDVQVFKVPQLLPAPLFVDQTVVEIVEKAGLERVGFKLLWDSDAPDDSSQDTPQ